VHRARRNSLTRVGSSTNLEGGFTTTSPAQYGPAADGAAKVASPAAAPTSGSEKLEAEKAEAEKIANNLDALGSSRTERWPPSRPGSSRREARARSRASRASSAQAQPHDDGWPRRGSPGGPMIARDGQRRSAQAENNQRRGRLRGEPEDRYAPHYRPPDADKAPLSALPAKAGREDHGSFCAH